MSSRRSFGDDCVVTYRLEPLEPRLLLSGSWLQGAELYTDASLTETGLVGSYIDETLSDVDQLDWRASQPIAGTRVDDPVEFLNNGWGSRAEVGLTGGIDTNWERFSVQWDGVVDITEDRQRLTTAADDGCRFWIDIDRDGAFEDSERFDNYWGRYSGVTAGERTPGLESGVYPIRIQYYENTGHNRFALVSAPYVPEPFVPTPDNPQQVVKAIVLNFDPRVPSEGNRLMHEVFNWQDPRMLAEQFEYDLEWATGGAIDIQVVEWRDLDAFPTFTDGFRYNPDQYVANRRANSGWHDTGTDFYELIESQNLLPPIDAGAVDEIWTFGDHYFSLLGEAWMGGPNSFFINGPSFPDAGFDRAIAGYGFSYERGVAEMIHNLCHRTENHGQRAFGSWNLGTPQTAFDTFSSNYLDTYSGPYGIGTCHVPANADGHYDYGDPRTVDSFAFDFANYPNMTWQTQPVSRDTWAMGPSPDYHRDFMDFYFGTMPRNDGADFDGRMANWFKYIWDFNSYEQGSGLGRTEDAFGAGPIVYYGGGTSYDLTVRYYDDTGVDLASLDTGDVRIVAPDGSALFAGAIAIGEEVATTSGTARTVAYTIEPPGGTWDASDNGSYRIELLPGAVTDTGGAPFTAGEVGSFRVAIYESSSINVNALLASGEASATHTEFDIGTVENLFDGNTGSLVRTPNVEPAVVTLEFDDPQTLTGFKTYFSHAWGDPAYRYMVEAADTLADLENRTGSYALLVPLTGTPSDEYSIADLGGEHEASVVRLTAWRLTGDNYIHIKEWQLLGIGEAEDDAPEASLASSGEAVHGATSHFIDVTFTDATAVDVPSIASGDIEIAGPGGFAVEPTFYDVDNHADGPERTATFWFEPPGGEWDGADSGVYTVTLVAGAVRDPLGNTQSGPQELGAFFVSMPEPQRVPPPDMAEFNASGWSAWAEGASASVYNDTNRVVAGGASIRFETDGGFDTSATYDAGGMADWDIGEATQLSFGIYAENPSPNSFQEGPWVRIADGDGHYYEYRYYENGNPATPLNGAVGQWVDFEVPIDPPMQDTGWRRFSAGSPPDLEHIASVAFHADTWDAGFTLWFDGVGFDAPVTLGDFDFNGACNGLDIPDFKAALADPDAWAANHPLRHHPDELGDFDGNGAFNGLDIPGFKQALAGGVAAADGSMTDAAATIVVAAGAGDSVGRTPSRAMPSRLESLKQETAAWLSWTRLRRDRGVALLRWTMVYATANSSPCEGIAGRFDPARPLKGNPTTLETRTAPVDARPTPYISESLHDPPAMQGVC